MRTLKKAIIIFSGAMILCLSACSSMESDAKKVARQSYKIEQNFDNWRISQKEEREIVEFQSRMLAKYGKDPKTKAKFDKLVDKEMDRLRKVNKK